MNNEKLLSKLAYIGLIAVILFGAMVAMSPKADAQEINSEIVEFQAVCFATDDIIDSVKNDFDTLLIIGQSNMTNLAITMIYNRETKEYAMITVVGDKVCVLDNGLGEANIHGDYY